MKHHKSIIVLAIIACAAIGGIAATETQDPLARRVQTLETQVRSLLRRVEVLEKHKLASTTPQRTEMSKRLKAFAFQREQKATPAAAKSFSSPLAVGQVAVLGKSNNARVVSIVDGNNMIVQMTVGHKTRLRTYRPREMWSAIASQANGDPSGAITKTVWVKGLNTADLADRSEVKYSEPLKITGTKTYTSVMGAAQTVFVLELVSN